MLLNVYSLLFFVYFNRFNKTYCLDLTNLSLNWTLVYLKSLINKAATHKSFPFISYIYL